MLSLNWAGNEAYDLRTKTGAYAGLTVKHPTKGFWRVYWSGNGTRGSARKFETLDAVLAFVLARRAKRAAA